MDIKAYMQIEDLESFAEDNGISVPRARGYRLMQDELPLDINKFLNDAIYIAAEEAVYGGFVLNPNYLSGGYDEDSLLEKILYRDSDGKYKIRWELIHGKKRKCLKYQLRKFRKIAKIHAETFNKYVGRSDILCVHARIGGANWEWCGCKDLETKPWFVEKTDCLYEGTYCNVYAKVNVEVKHNG